MILLIEIIANKETRVNTKAIKTEHTGIRHVLLALAKIKESEVCLAFCLNVSYEQKIICNTI